jgi:hypothetical protein
MIEKVTISAKNLGGNEVFLEEVAGWYLLRGVSRLYEVPIPEEVCANMKTLNVAVKMKEGITLNRKIDVDKSMCSQ